MYITSDWLQYLLNEIDPLASGDSLRLKTLPSMLEDRRNCASLILIVEWRGRFRLDPCQ